MPFRMIVQDHAGKITVERGDPGGAQFSISLPAAPLIA